MIEAFGKQMLTAYKIIRDNKTIFFDFGASTIKKTDVQDIDYIFITHEHLDHWEMLLNYPLMKCLNKNTQIYASKTTKDIILEIFNKKEKSYTLEAREYLLSIIQNINVALFNTKYKLTESLSFEFFRSGHTFGSAMIYLISDEEKLLYTGDFDYVKKDSSRQYFVPYGVEVDTLICDGTNVVKREFKGMRIDEIRTYIERHKFVDYQIRPEKAVIYAQYLSEKIDDTIILYTEQLLWYLDIITNNGYNAFINDRVMFETKKIDYKLRYPNKKIIRLTTNKNDYLLDNKLGLHITSSELNKFINENFITKPKRIYLGHYNMNDVIESGYNSREIKLLNEGVNNYE